jgi:hypothetical protein
MKIQDKKPELSEAKGFTYLEFIQSLNSVNKENKYVGHAA